VLGCRNTSTTQSVAQNPPELLTADAVDNEVGRRTQNFEDVAQFHEEQCGRWTVLRVVLPNNLQQAEIH